VRGVIYSDKMDINSDQDNIFKRQVCSKQTYYEFLVGFCASDSEYEVWWRKKNGRSHEEISKELGISYGTSKNLLKRLRKKIRKNIKKSKDRGKVL
jgi:hypothetical protein